MVNVRPARADEAERCMELLAMLGGAAGEPMADGAETFRSLLDGARGEVLVAEEAGVILGMASVSYNLAMRYGGEYCQLEELIVTPEARGKNVGARLVEATLERARARGCAEYGLYLIEATETNWPFYENFGFERVGTELRQRLR